MRLKKNLENKFILKHIEVLITKFHNQTRFISQINIIVKDKILSLNEIILEQLIINQLKIFHKAANKI
jgi:TRAP-type C4-dicarboxylate transport system substrate-binding protein